MTTANARKGSETERMVAKYLREQGFWMADRRLREGRADDQGDIDGVPYTTIQVKFEKANRYQAWITATLKQRDTAGTPLCMLVRRVLYKPVEQWEALVPPMFFFADWAWADGHGSLSDNPLDENEAWTWVRMDLRLAVAALHQYVKVLTASGPVERELSSDRYSSTTESS